MRIAAFANVSSATVPGGLEPTISSNSMSTLREDRSYRSSSADSRPYFKEGYEAPARPKTNTVRHFSDPRQPCPCKDRTGTEYTRNSARRTCFLLIRLSSFLLGIAMFIVALAGCLTLGKGRWIAPVVSPCASAWYPQGYDSYMIIRHGKRASPYLRMWWDGGAAVAFAVTTGVLMYLVFGVFEWSTINDQEDGVGAAALGVVLVVGMVYQLACEIVVCVGGVMQSKRLHRESKGIPMTPA